MRHFPFEIFFFFWGGLLGFEAEFLMFVKKKIHGREGREKLLSI